MTKLNPVQKAALYQDLSATMHQYRVTGCMLGIERFTPDQLARLNVDANHYNVLQSECLARLLEGDASLITQHKALWPWVDEALAWRDGDLPRRLYTLGNAWAVCCFALLVPRSCITSEVVAMFDFDETRRVYDALRQR